jgi:sugar O-acyltransferase (sialic acid O-acetyltransferase NeuD family)
VREALVLVGGGGHCKSCIDVIQAEGRFEIAGIVENPDLAIKGVPGDAVGARCTVPLPRNGSEQQAGIMVMGYPVIGTDDDLPWLVKQYRNFLITVGQIQNPAVRIRLFELIRGLGGHFPVIISPNAYVSRTALVGAGTIVMHHTVVNTEASVGVNCILNTGALVEHESVVGDHCHISTYAILNGRCSVGSRTFIGSRTVLSNNISIPEDTQVSAGSTVLRSLAEPGTYIGYPLRKIR